MCGTVLISVSDRDKGELNQLAQAFVDAGFDIVATGGTYQQLVDAGIQATKVFKAHEGRPNLIDSITNGKVDLVVNTPSSSTESAEDDSYIRKAAIKAHIPYMTTMAAGLAGAEGVKTLRANGGSGVKSLQEIHEGIH